jgi:hypothetical protein
MDLLFIIPLNNQMNVELDFFRISFSIHTRTIIIGVNCKFREVLEKHVKGACGHVCPSAKKSHETTEGIPKLANDPRITPHGNANNRMAATRDVSERVGNFGSHDNSESFKTKTPRCFGPDFSA